MWTSSSDVQGHPSARFMSLSQGAVLYPELQMLIDYIKFLGHGGGIISVIQLTIPKAEEEATRMEELRGNICIQKCLSTKERPEREQRWGSSVLTQVVMRDDEHDAWINLIQSKTSWLSSSCWEHVKHQPLPMLWQMRVKMKMQIYWHRCSGIHSQHRSSGKF